MKIRKSTVWYVYSDPIVDMLIDSFGYQLEIDETIGSKDESQVDVSSGSITDYCCWWLYKKKGKAKTMRSKHYAQVLGYYCLNKESLDHTVIAILLNEYADEVIMGFFIFPYAEPIANSKENTMWGLQALLLPMHTCKSADVIRKCTFLELIYLFCMNCDCHAYSSFKLSRRYFKS